METHAAKQNGVESVWQELVELVNRQFETPPFRRLLDLRFNQARAQALSIQMKHYVANRRDCWAFVAGAAPLSVMRLIWEHEGEELMGDKAAGKVDHITLAVQEGKIFGLSPEDYERVRPLDAAVGVFLRVDPSGQGPAVARGHRGVGRAGNAKLRTTWCAAVRSRTASARTWNGTWGFR